MYVHQTTEGGNSRPAGLMPALIYAYINKLLSTYQHTHS